MELIKMFKFTFLLLTFSCINLFASENTVYSEKLLELGKLDQEVRSGQLGWNEGIKIDKDNLSQLKVLIDKYGFPTIEKVGEQAHFSAFLIAQHAVSDISFMLYYLDETKKRLGTKSVEDQTYAYLLDRTNQMNDKKQVYGTQGACVNGKYEVSEVENDDKLSNLRSSVGLLPLNEFSKQACSGEMH